MALTLSGTSGIVGAGIGTLDSSGHNVTGVVTATSFVGSGANLTGITGTTINTNTNDYLITGTGTANTLQGEANLTFDGTRLDVGGAAVSQTRTVNIGSNAEANLAIETHNDATSETANIRFYKSGNTGASPQVVETNDNIAQIQAYGYDGTDYNCSAAAIKLSVDGAPGSNDMPGKITFSTTADGASSPNERLKIDAAGNTTVVTGNLVIGTAGNGISFSATADSGATGISNMSELLDDYEEGDWDPTLPYSDGGIGSVAGWYTKIGKVVCVQFGFVVLTNSDTSGFQIAGFPFTNNGYSTMSIVSEANQGGSGLALKMNIGQAYGHVHNQENDEKKYNEFSNCWVWGAGTYMTTS